MACSHSVIGGQRCYINVRIFFFFVISIYSNAMERLPPKFYKSDCVLGKIMLRRAFAYVFLIRYKLCTPCFKCILTTLFILI